MSPTLSALDVNDERDVAKARQHARTVAARLGFPPERPVEDRVGRLRVRPAPSPATPGAAGSSSGSKATQRGRWASGPSPTGPATPTGGSDHLLDAARRIMDDFLSDPNRPGRAPAFAMSKALPRDLQPGTRPARRSPTSCSGSTRRRRSPTRPAARTIELLEAPRTASKPGNANWSQVSHELEDTNRGRDGPLRRTRRAGRFAPPMASEMKTRFLANVSHELRTPLSSILSLARLLIDRADGELFARARPPGGTFILRSAHDLTSDGQRPARPRPDRGRARGDPSTSRRSTSATSSRRSGGCSARWSRPAPPSTSSFEVPDGLPTMDHGRGEALAGPPQLPVQRPQVYRERGEVRLKAEPGPPEYRSSSRSPTPGSASGPSTSRGSSKSSARSTARSSDG